MYTLIFCFTGSIAKRFVWLSLGWLWLFWTCKATLKMCVSVRQIFWSAWMKWIGEKKNAAYVSTFDCCLPFISLMHLLHSSRRINILTLLKFELVFCWDHCMHWSRVCTERSHCSLCSQGRQQPTVQPQWPYRELSVTTSLEMPTFLSESEDWFPKKKSFSITDKKKKTQEYILEII